MTVSIIDDGVSYLVTEGLRLSRQILAMLVRDLETYLACKLTAVSKVVFAGRD